MMLGFDPFGADSGFKRFRRRMILSSIVVLGIMAALIGRDLIDLWHGETQRETQTLTLLAEAMRADVDAAILSAAQKATTAAADPDLNAPPWFLSKIDDHPAWLALRDESGATRLDLAVAGPAAILTATLPLDRLTSLAEVMQREGIEGMIAGPGSEARLAGARVSSAASTNSIRLASTIPGLDYLARRDHAEIVKAWTLRHIGLIILGLLVAALVMFQASLALHQAQRIEDQGEALRRSIEATIRESQAKTTLLANMSHELRTPLNAIIGFSDLMREEMFGPVGSDRYRGYISDISQAGRHMLALVEDLLNYTSMGAQIRKLSPIWLDPCDVLAICAQMIQPEARNAGIELILSAPVDLPRVFADERALRQILLNLLSNAIKFTPVGGNVTLAGVHEAEGIVIEVIDTGIGIRADDLARIFDPFVQASPSLARGRGGIGLGLAIVKGLTEASGFSISVASEPDIGTTFRIHVPLDKTRPRSGRA